MLKIWLYSHRLPWKLFVPPLTITLIDAPPATPCSALNEFVVMFTVWIESAGGTYAIRYGSQPYVFTAPSMRVVLLMSSTPFTFKDIAREGFDAVEFCSMTLAAPGINV